MAPISGTASPLKQTYSSKVVTLPHGKGRILLLADIRGDILALNRLVVETGAIACIHTGDFGFFEPDSLERIADKTLKHLITYSPTIPQPLRTRLLAPTLSRPNLISLLNPGDRSFPLSQFPQLLPSSQRKIQLKVPTFAVYGACEDVRIIEKFRTGEYDIPNLTVLDEATTRVLEVGGVRLRLFGLGGALVMAKMFDNGEGNATIAGGGGTLWTTTLQIGELLDTAQRVYDPSETRLLITHASIGREPLLALLALALKADLTCSAGLHFRYGASFNDFAVQDEVGASWWAKVARGRGRFMDVWEMVKGQVESVIDSEQKAFLDKALAMINRSQTPPPNAPPGTLYADEPAWKNTWHWNLSDSSFGHLILDIREGRVSAELKSQGFNFAHRTAPQQQQQQQSAAASSSNASATANNNNARGPAASVSSNNKAIQNGPAAVSNTSAPSANNGGAPAAPAAAAAASSSNNSNTKAAAAVVASSPAEGAAPSLPPSAPSPSNRPAAALPSNTTSPSKDTPTNGASSSTTSTLPSSAIPPTTTTPSGPGRNPHTLFITQLQPPITEPELRSFFGPAGEKIKLIKFVYEGPGGTGAQKRFCYVEFSNRPDMDLALANQGPSLKGGPPPKVVVSEPPIARGQGGGGGSGDFTAGGAGGGSMRGRGGMKGSGSGGRGGFRGGRGGGSGGGSGGGGQQGGALPATAA